MAEMYVGTIHGYCLHLLQTHLSEYLKYQVLTEVQPRMLVDRNSKKSGLTTCPTLRAEPTPYRSGTTGPTVPGGDERHPRGRRRPGAIPEGSWTR